MSKCKCDSKSSKCNKCSKCDSKCDECDKCRECKSCGNCDRYNNCSDCSCTKPCKISVEVRETAIQSTVLNDIFTKIEAIDHKINEANQAIEKHSHQAEADHKASVFEHLTALKQSQEAQATKLQKIHETIASAPGKADKTVESDVKNILSEVQSISKILKNLFEGQEKPGNLALKLAMASGGLFLLMATATQILRQPHDSPSAPTPVATPVPSVTVVISNLVITPTPISILAPVYTLNCPTGYSVCIRDAPSLHAPKKAALPCGANEMQIIDPTPHEADGESWVKVKYQPPQGEPIEGWSVRRFLSP